MNKLAFIVLLLMTGCSSDVDRLESDNIELEEKVVQLEEELAAAKDKNERLSDAVNESREAVNNLKNNVDRLEDENWRDVVPDIAAPTADADAAIETASEIANEY